MNITRDEMTEVETTNVRTAIKEEIATAMRDSKIAAQA
jgi:hypothetical protein